MNFILHVVGFDVGDEDVSQLECAAQTGDGLYFDARNAEDLSAALDRAVATPAESSVGTLSVKALKNDELVDALVHVSPSGSKEVVAKGRTYTGEETNPRVFPLEDGEYDILVHAVRLKGEVKQLFETVAVSAGAVVEKIADFSAGELAIQVTRNGTLSDATVQVYEAGTRTRLAGGRTYVAEKTNPRVLQLTAGIYDVEIGSVEISDKPKHRWEDVSVVAKERTEQHYDFLSGTISIGAVKGDALIDAVVKIRNIETGQSVAGGRTYTSKKSNPRVKELNPGRYQVEVKPVKLKDIPKQNLEVTGEAGQTAAHIVNFGE